MKKVLLILNFLLLLHLINSARPQIAQRAANLKSKRLFEAAKKNFNLSDEYKEYLENFQEGKCNEISWDTKYANETIVMNRQNRFNQRNAAIKRHNKLYSQGKVTFSQRPMRWTDWTSEHKYKSLCGTRMAPKYRNAPPVAPNYLKMCQSWRMQIPQELNRCNFPNPIRDQLDCGCCWAFSTIQVLEGLIWQCMGKKTELSVQQMVDCDYYNSACDGGWPTLALLEIALKGVCSWNEYSYLNEQQERCKVSACKKVVNPFLINKQMEVELKGDEDCLKKLLMRVGPLIIAIHANEEFMVYGDGYYENDECPKDDPNHAMVLCGWGVDESFGEYWLIRNSWGTDWGENGYVRIKMNNTCGVSSWAMWPVIQGCDYLDVFQTGSAKRVFESEEEIGSRRFLF